MSSLCQNLEVELSKITNHCVNYL